MTGAPRSSLWIAGIALVVALLAVAGVLVVGASLHDGGAASRGEVIFQTGRDSSGPVIARSNTTGGGMMGGGMMGGGCATCHGSDGHGRTTMMFAAPDITYDNLTDPAGMLTPDGAREPAFTDETLRLAVTRGIDPEGGRLEWPMPQWQLSGSQWGDLLTYLKTLN